MLRVILSLVIAAHGIGHVLFLVPLLGAVDWGQSTRSWLFTDASTARIIGSILWIMALIGFGAAVYGLLSQQPWWRSAAVIAAVVSTGGLLVFWASPVTSPVVAALIVDAVIVGALLIAHFPSVEAVGA